MTKKIRKAAGLSLCTAVVFSPVWVTMIALGLY